MLAPLGGAKGYALALLVEALTGGMVGPALASDVRDMYRPDQVAEPQRIAHLVITLDPDRFEQGGPPGGPSRLDTLADNVRRAGGRLPGAGKVRFDDLDPSASIRLAPALDAELRAWADARDAHWPVPAPPLP